MKTIQAMICADGSPVAIGGVGGSGTRLIAELFQAIGFDLGEDLNPERDNLWFTLLFKRPAAVHASMDEFAWLLQVFVSRMTGAPFAEVDRARLTDYLALDTFQGAEHVSGWRRARLETLFGGRNTLHWASPRRWGWKEPNTHLYARKLFDAVPGFKYVHVMRSGLDMAFSANQNQLRLWGADFLGRECEVSPRNSLSYWCEVHRRLLPLQDLYSDRFLLLNYDRLLVEPTQGIERMVRFLGVPVTSAVQEKLVQMIIPTSGVGRHTGYDLGQFDLGDLEFVRSMGFEVKTLSLIDK